MHGKTLNLDENYFGRHTFAVVAKSHKIALEPYNPNESQLSFKCFWQDMVNSRFVRASFVLSELLF